MEKVCQNWPAHFTSELIDPKHWDLFKKHAEKASAEIHLVKNYAEATAKLKELLGGFDWATKEICAVGAQENEHLAKIYAEVESLGYTVYQDKFAIAEHAPQADLGISVAEFAVAETGSVCVDTYSYEARVTGMLPPTHIVFLNANYVTETVSSAFEIIAKGFDKGHMGFITGPSRTADIERVLTLGVHGPSRFLIIALTDEF